LDAQIDLDFLGVELTFEEFILVDDGLVVDVELLVRLIAFQEVEDLEAMLQWLFLHVPFIDIRILPLNLVKHALEVLLLLLVYAAKVNGELSVRVAQLLRKLVLIYFGEIIEGVKLLIKTL